jgi:hypothetical protein
MEDYKPPLGGMNPEPIFILGSLEEMMRKKTNTC